MDVDISAIEMQRLSNAVVAAMGLLFAEPRWPDLWRGIVASAAELGFPDPQSLARCLSMTSPTKEQTAVLAKHLTVGETYFFRDRESFDLLSREMLPALTHGRAGRDRRLRIWSVACCTGEEPYSIAIALRESIPEFNNWNITLLATDLNPNALSIAAAGIFGEWSFRDRPPSFKQRYFTPLPDGRFEILPEIRRMVRFSCLNLVEDVYPSYANDTTAMDIIFCRNVLMYFPREVAQKVVHNLYRSQADGGWLVVSAGELPHVHGAGYAKGVIDNPLIFCKSTATGLATSQTPARAGGVVGGSLLAPATSGSAPTVPSIRRKPASIRKKRSAAPLAEAASDSKLAAAAALYDQGLYSEAAEALRSGVGNQPGNGSAYRLLVRSLANSGKLDEALEYCDRWITADKLNAVAQYLRAVIHQERGAIDEAVRSLRGALYLDSRFVLAHFALGNIARAREQDREADRHLKNALDVVRASPADEIVPESDGVTAGRFAQIIGALIQAETAA